MGTAETQAFMRVKLSQSMGDAGLKDGALPSPSSEYVAFTTSRKRQIRLKICPITQYWRRLEYAKLFEIGENGLGETELFLGYPTAIVRVNGRNLKAITDEIADERCVVIQAFDKRRWLPPSDNAAPFIQSILIIPSTGSYGAATIKAGQMPTDKPVTN